LRSFEFKKSYEELKINDRVYRIDLSDDKVKEYRKVFVEFHDQSVLIQNVDGEDQEQLFDKSKEMVTKVIDTLLGAGSFVTLYEESGNSLLNMVDLVACLTDVVREKTEEFQTSNLDKYLKKPKGKKK
jgi:hypothetical protein